MKTWVAGTTAQSVSIPSSKDREPTPDGLGTSAKPLLCQASLFWSYWSHYPPALKTGSPKGSLQRLLPKTGPQALLSSLIWCRGRTDPDA